MFQAVTTRFLDERRASERVGDGISTMPTWLQPRYGNRVPIKMQILQAANMQRERGTVNAAALSCVAPGTVAVATVLDAAPPQQFKLANQAYIK